MDLSQSLKAISEQVGVFVAALGVPAFLVGVQGRTRICVVIVHFHREPKLPPYFIRK